MKTLAAFIRENRIRMACEWTDSNPNMEPSEFSRDASHFLVTLKVGRRSMRLHFSQGSAHTAEPTIADVLSCLADDSNGIQERTFEEWASDLGYDSDSRKAFATYETVKAQAEQLEQLLGHNAFQTLILDVQT